MDTALGINSSARIKLDPRTKLFMLLAVNIVMVGGGYRGISAFIRPVMAMLPLLLLVAERRYSKALPYLILTGAALCGETFLVSRTHGILNLLIVILSGLISRFTPGLVMGYYVVSTTKIAEFIAAMERMRLPQCIIIPFSVMLRFFPTVRAENSAITDAMRMRGIQLGGKKPGAMLEYRLVPMLMCTVKIGEELSAAALTRGLGKPVRRTNISHIGFKTPDFILLFVTAGALISWLILQ
ncbi:MAG: cobalt transport protein [Eubacterium sp.]|jgi:energy-coupling factor transport system permease protein|nr:cobalt transport protein [Eubacterium sp.]